MKKLLGHLFSIFTGLIETLLSCFIHVVSILILIVGRCDFSRGDMPLMYIIYSTAQSNGVQARNNISCNNVEISMMESEEQIKK